MWYFLWMRLHDQTKPITGLALTAAVRGNATIRADHHLSGAEAVGTDGFVVLVERGASVWKT